MIEFGQKQWNNPKKIQAREETIINEYRKNFGAKLPEDKQYWTLCGQQTTNDGKPLENGELDQLIKADLLDYNQFYGVDISKKIINSNKKAFPDSHWLQGDFYWTLRENVDNFNPAIVNADFTSMANKCSGYIADLLVLLHHSCEEVMLVANILLEFQNFTDRGQNMQYVIKKLEKMSLFQSVWKSQLWHLNPEYYRYKGNSVMGSIIFTKGV